MVVCKFYQQGNCRFGANCKFEHPGFNNNAQSQRGPPGGNQYNNNSNSNRFDAFQQGGQGRGGQGGGGRGRGRDHYQPNQQQNNSLESRMSGFGRGRGGFGGGNNRQQQGRNQNHGRLDNLEMRLPDERRNNRRGRGGRNNEPPPVMKITRAGIMEDLTTERPIWMMSSYSPTPRWPKQLFEGYDTEQSPEEVRVLFELAKAQGNPQEYIQLEQRLAADAQARRDRALNDMDSVMQYLKDGETEHPNRLDIATESEPRGQAANVFAVPDDHPLNVEKYGYPRGRNNNQTNQNNNQQGAFARNQPNNQSLQGFSNTPSGPTGFGGAPTSGFNQPAFGTPSQPQNFATQPQFGQSGGGFTQQTGFGTPQNPQPNPPQNGGFGGFGQPSSMQDASMNSGFGTQPAFGGAPFGAPPQQQQPQGFGFGQQPPQQQQQQQQQQGFQAQPQNGFPQVNGFPAQQPQIMATQQSSDINSYVTRHPNGQLATWKGQPVQYDQEGNPLYQRPDGNWERIWFPDGPPPNGGSSVGETVVDDTMKSQYGFVRDNGAFEGGVMPVAPPTGDMIRWDL